MLQSHPPFPASTDRFDFRLQSLRRSAVTPPSPPPPPWPATSRSSRSGPVMSHSSPRRRSRIMQAERERGTNWEEEEGGPMQADERPRRALLTHAAMIRCLAPRRFPHMQHVGAVSCSVSSHGSIAAVSVCVGYLRIDDCPHSLSVRSASCTPPFGVSIARMI